MYSYVVIHQELKRSTIRPKYISSENKSTENVPIQVASQKDKIVDKKLNIKIHK